jgi:preprotein translocase subunit SecE
MDGDGLQECSSVGRASVSKTEGRGFESLRSCHYLSLKGAGSTRSMSMTKNPIEFFREVRQEVAKVTWPTRRETMITTTMVFIFVVLASIFFLVADKIIGFAVQLILGIS